MFPLPAYNDDIGKGYMKNGTFSALQTCTEISDKCQDVFILNSELLEQLQEISHFIKFFLILHSPTVIMSLKKTLQLPLGTI